MSARLEEYKRLIGKVMASESEGKLPDDEADACFDAIDELWTSMTDDEKNAAQKWRQERAT